MLFLCNCLIHFSARKSLFLIEHLGIKYIPPLYLRFYQLFYYSNTSVYCSTYRSVGGYRYCDKHYSGTVGENCNRLSSSTMHVIVLAFV